MLAQNNVATSDCSKEIAQKNTIHLPHSLNTKMKPKQDILICIIIIHNTLQECPWSAAGGEQGEGSVSQGIQLQSLETFAGTYNYT